MKYKHFKQALLFKVGSIVIQVLKNSKIDEELQDFGRKFWKKLFLDATQSPCKDAWVIAIITRA